MSTRTTLRKKVALVITATALTAGLAAPAAQAQGLPSTEQSAQGSVSSLNDLTLLRQLRDILSSWRNTQPETPKLPAPLEPNAVTVSCEDGGRLIEYKARATASGFYAFGSIPFGSWSHGQDYTAGEVIEFSVVDFAETDETAIQALTVQASNNDRTLFEGSVPVDTSVNCAA
ncbi:MAG: hypothetical protein ACTJG2_00965 [Candidatus Saccharimonadales bacterium]